MALVECEHLVDRSLSTRLESNHLTGPGREDLVVGRVLQLAIPLVAGALARVLAAVKAVAERLPLCLVQVLPDVVVVDLVNLNVLRSKNSKS